MKELDDEYFTAGPYRNHTITAVSAPDGDARVTIRNGPTVVREFLWPAYKVWNIAAHAEEIIEGEIVRCNDALAHAGSDLLGGGVVPRDIK